MKLLSILLVSINFLLIGCGTTTGIPSHGGGKRFAIEQLVVSSSARLAINDIPWDVLKGKSVSLDVNVIYDEGGGNLQGGKLSLSPFISSEYTNSGNKSTTTTQLVIQKSDNSYVKDQVYFSSDSRYLSNLISAALVRNGVSLIPDADGFDYVLEINVDVFGTWLSRTDYLFANNEKLLGVTSLEYAITAVKKHKDANSKPRVTGRASYQSEYIEKYTLWLGPFETDITNSKFEWGSKLGTFGNGPVEFSTIDNTSKPTFNSNSDVNKAILLPQPIK
jgi:hypothetical protein